MGTAGHGYQILGRFPGSDNLPSNEYFGLGSGQGWAGPGSELDANNMDSSYGESVSGSDSKFFFFWKRRGG